MKKQLFIVGLSLLAASFGMAQQNGTTKQVAATARPLPAHTAKLPEGFPSAGMQARPSTTLSTCAVINKPLPAGWTPTLYSASSNPADGHFNGLNSSGDREKAMFFNTSSLSFTTLNQVDIDFGAATSTNRSKVVTLRIYNVSGGNPGTQIGAAAVTIGDIMDDLAGGYTTSFYFLSGVTLPANKQFFVSLDVTGLSLAAGDRLGMGSNAIGESANAAWEKWSDNSWHSYTTAYTTPPDLSFLMFPYLSNGPVASSFTASANPICQGSTITYNYGTSDVAGGYYWSAGTSASTSYTTNTVTSPSVVYNTAGTFTTNLTNANACGAISGSQLTVTVNPKPTVTASPSSTTVCSGSSVVLNGGGANTYAWTGGISNGVAFTPPASQNYTVTGTAANGCTATAVASVVVNSAGPAVTANTTGNNICAGQSITLTGSGASTYTWTGGVTNGVAFTPPSTQTYTVIGGTGTCTNSAVITITVNPLPTVNANASATSVCTGNSVTLTGGGTATSYAWTGGVTNGVAFNPTATNTYTVTGTLGSCTNTAAVTINVTAGPNVTASASSNTVCQGQPVTLTGNGATSYAWTGGVTNGVAFNPPATGTYTVTGTTGSCTNTAVVTVVVNNAPAVTANASASTICSGANVTLLGGGANTYVWTGGVSNGVPFSPSASGSYTVTGTAANGCTATATASITVNPTPVVTANTSTSSVCPGGQVTLTGGGATSYLWTDGVVNGTPFTPTVTKSYTVTGANGACTNTAAVTVVVNTPPTVTSVPAVATSCSGSNVTLSGNGAASYSWSGGIANGTPFSPSASGTYTVTGTAANGCTATAVATVNVVSSLNVTANTSSTSVCQGQSVTLTGGGASSYSWTGGVNDGVSFVPSSTASYTVTGTSGACSNTAVVSVTVNSLPSVTANATSTNVCAGNNVTLTGGGANSYTWSNGVTNGIPFSPSASGVYTVTGTSNGCSNTAVVTLVVTSNPTVTAIASSTSICVGTSVTLTGLGATTYTWTNGVTNNTPFSPTSTTIYLVTGSTNGCVGTATVQIVVNTCTGIDEADATSAAVVAYPNPSTGDFLIQGSKQAIITIANELGQVIAVAELKAENNFSYQVNGLSNGIYFLSGNAVKQKIVVAK